MQESEGLCTPEFNPAVTTNIGTAFVRQEWGALRGTVSFLAKISSEAGVVSFCAQLAENKAEAERLRAAQAELTAQLEALKADNKALLQKSAFAASLAAEANSLRQQASDTWNCSVPPILPLLMLCVSPSQSPRNATTRGAMGICFSPGFGGLPEKALDLFAMQLFTQQRSNTMAISKWWPLVSFCTPCCTTKDNEQTDK